MATVSKTGVINSGFLCLRCRRPGHLAVDCTAAASWTHNSEAFEWFFSPARKSLNKLLSDANQTCQRCKKLELIKLLQSDIPWNSPQELIECQQQGSAPELIRKLGNAGSVEFSATCPVCVCLFALTPSPAAASDEILILPDWTWNRLCGENGMEYDSEDKRRYAKCLLVALEPNATNISFYVRSHRGDALCMQDEYLRPGETLGGRQIASDRFNLPQCISWLNTCQRLHGKDCEPEFTEELQGIRLVDVDARKIVAYPGSPCDYAALSYVWGGVEQPSYHVGSQLSSLPQTIEDALQCAKLLGKRYLWVDSLCIDQKNEEDKTDQIGRMWSIYRGSSITLISLSSSSANSGLPRFGSADSDAQPQLSCTIDGIKLVGLMPTLSQYIWTESWGSRAWTLQEALLSHRCLYISDHQLYFECEVVQHCESLDETRSWVHNLTAATSGDPEHWLTWAMDQNGSGCLRNLLDTPADRFLHWGQKVTLYSYRKMTNQDDGLRAFSGVLQRLQTMYKDGFWWGLPLEDFQWALLWQTQWPARRRTGFPTWCWAGWDAGIMTPFPIDMKNPHRSPVPLRIWKAVDKDFSLIFDAQFRHDGQVADDDALDGPGEKRDPTGTAIDPRKIWDLSELEDPDERCMFVESFTIQLQPDWSRPQFEQALGGLRGFYEMKIAQVRCLLYIMTSDSFIERSSSITASTKYLVLAANARRGYEEYQILVVLETEQVHIRLTSISLWIPTGNVEQVLKELEVRQEHFVIV